MSCRKIGGLNRPRSTQIVEVASVVALVLELGAVSLSHQLGNLFDVAEGVAKDVLIGGDEILLLPIILPFLVARGHRIEREIHRAHVERAHFRRKLGGGGEPLLHRHDHGAAGGDVHHRVGRLFDARQKLPEHRGIAGRPPILGVTCVKVQHRRTRFRRRDRLLGDLIGCDRQRVRHGRRVDRAGDGAGDDDLVVGFGSHRRSPSRYYP